MLLGLLWAPSQAVGRSGATVGAITRAAVGIADAEGLAAVTMRRVADVVGVGAMTLYSYVPGHAELLELMLDDVARAVYPPGTEPETADGWRAGVQRVVEANWAHHLAHPWTLEVSPGRPVLGPGVAMKYEAELRPLDGVGLTDDEMDNLLTTVLGMVESAAKAHVGLERVRAETGLTDDQWWAMAAPVLAPAISHLDLPTAGRVGESVASAGRPAESLRYGLDRLLDGVQAGLDRAVGRPASEG